MSTIGKPFIDRGYYVLPIEVTTAILHQEGIDPGKSWEIPPQRLHQYFGADAVLYVNIEEWDTSYLVVASRVAVGLDYRLVDTRTGAVIWEDELIIAETSDVGQPSGVGTSDLLVWLIISTIDATVTALATDYVPLAYRANSIALSRLPPGHYHSGYESLRKAVTAWENAPKASN